MLAVGIWDLGGFWTPVGLRKDSPKINKKFIFDAFYKPNLPLINKDTVTSRYLSHVRNRNIFLHHIDAHATTKTRFHTDSTIHAPNNSEPVYPC